MTKSNWILFILTSSFSFAAYGQEGDNKVTFDFTKMTISTFGVYNTSQDEKKSGISAEVKARKNAITNLNTYFKNSCHNTEKGQLGTKSGWETHFHSQGSELFSNGFLKVSLSAPFRDILKTPTRKKHVKTEDGKKIAFSMLFSVPGNLVQCGAIGVDVGNNKKIMISPAEVVSSSIGLTVVKLIFDGKSELKPSSPEDASLLQNSTLVKDQNVPSGVIPVVVVVPE